MAYNILPSALLKKTITWVMIVLPWWVFAAGLENLAVVTPATVYCLAPRWSPEGKLYCSTPQYTEILQINTLNGSLKPVASGMGCGFRFAFASDGSIFYKMVGEEGRELWKVDTVGTRRRLAQSPMMGLPAWYDGAIRVQMGDGVRSWSAEGAEIGGSADGWAYQDGGGIFRIRAGAPPQRISPQGTEACLPELSPDGKRLIYEALGRGVMLVSLETGASHSIGPGNNACWSNDGSFFLFDRAADDGHRLTAGDIFLMSRDGGPALNLTENTDLIATHPSISPDGQRVAFEAEGRIWVGELRR